MVVYADTVFLINFISAYTLLYILGLFINKTSVKRTRLVLSALTGGLTATVVFCVEMPIYIAYTLRIISIFLMVFTAFFELRRQILTQVAWFILSGGIITFVMMFTVSLASEPLRIITKAGIIYFDIPQRIFLPLLGISYIIMILFIKMFKNRKNKKYYKISVTHNDKTIDVTALFDSGNLLKEPITGKCVSVLEWDTVRKLFNLDCDFSDIEQHAEEMKLWAVPFSSLGNRNGIMYAFLADRVEIPEENKCHNKSFIGIYDKPLSKSREYHALINAGLL